MTCCALLQKLAYAQEGLSLLRTYLEHTPDDALAWVFFAAQCLEQQVDRDAVASFSCLDDAGPEAVALRAAGALAPSDYPQGEYVVRFGRCHTRLFDEGIEALQQSLWRAPQAPTQVRRYVSAAYNQYENFVSQFIHINRLVTSDVAALQAAQRRLEIIWTRFGVFYSFDDHIGRGAA